MAKDNKWPPKWQPTKRLPRIGQTILMWMECTNEDGQKCECYGIGYHKGKGEILGIPFSEEVQKNLDSYHNIVRAWMPLPRPPLREET